MLNIFEKIFIASAAIIVFLLILICIIGIVKIIIAAITV